MVSVLLLLLLTCYTALTEGERTLQPQAPQDSDYDGDTDVVIYPVGNHGVSRTHHKTGFYYMDYEVVTALSGNLFKLKSLKATDTYGWATYLSGGHGSAGSGLQTYLDCANDQHGGLCRIFSASAVGKEEGEALRYGDTVRFTMTHYFPADPHKTYRSIAVEGDAVSASLDCSGAQEEDDSSGAQEEEDRSCMDFLIESAEGQADGLLVTTRDKIMLKSAVTGSYLLSGANENHPQASLGNSCPSGGQMCKRWLINTAQVNGELYELSTVYLYSEPDQQGDVQLVHPDMKAVSRIPTDQYQSATFCQLRHYTVLMFASADFDGNQANAFLGAGTCQIWSGDGSTYRSLKTFPSNRHPDEKVLERGSLVFGRVPTH